MARPETREVIFVVARARDGTIAKAGDVPWKIREDSLPGLLPGRRHIVLTRQRGWQAEGAEPVHSLEEALALAGPGDVAVIGGNDVFELFLPLATRLEITEIHEDTAWREVARDERSARDGDPAYAFVTLERAR
jgi:dihydrofolate reductase